MSLAPRLTDELTDDIIDFLADDHDALRIAALVNSRWTSRSHFLLFSSLVLRSSYPLPTFGHMPHTHSFSGYLDRLRLHPNICNYVRILELRGYDEKERVLAEVHG